MRIWSLYRRIREWFESTTSELTLDPSDWIHIHDIPGGWSYVRYDDLFDFLISPLGDRVYCRWLADVSMESFQSYALGRIFSFALVKKGYEPLHAATVVVNQKAVAFLGASTYGKSSLAACFVASGYPLLTDDVLRLEEQGNRFLAFPGPPRLKLFPRIARLYLGDASVGVPMNHLYRSRKFVFSLGPSQACAIPTPLRAIYVVTPPRRVYRKQSIAIAPLPGVEALVSILTFTHNHELTGRERLARQLNAATRLAEMIPIRSLSYPRVLSSLPEVKAAVLADLKAYVDPI